MANKQTNYSAQRKYAIKNYNQYTINLRIDNDHELIAFVENQKKVGKNISEIFRQMVDFYLKYKEK